MDLRYEIFHSEYQGPLDGLLDASRSMDVALSRVNISALIDDFASHLREDTDRSVNQLSESLIIFSELVRIKTRGLLPTDDEPETEEPAEPEGSETEEFYQLVSERLRDEAERRSQLYESTPDSLPDEVREGETRYREVTLYELIHAFRDIMATTRDKSTPDIEITNEFETSDQMEYITTRVSETSPIRFRGLLSSTPSREEIIVTFLAVLQLVKQGDLRLIQQVSGGSIKVVSPDDLNTRE